MKCPECKKNTLEVVGAEAGDINGEPVEHEYVKCSNCGFQDEWNW